MRIELRLGGTIAVGSACIAVADAYALLWAVERKGSVQGVAVELGLSYRAAWERLRALEAGFGRRLVQKTRGHGSALTAEGEALRAALARASAGLAPSLARETRAMQACLADILGNGAFRPTMAVSHDPLLMDALADWGEAEVSVVGSHEAVARLVDGRADVAGFHCGDCAPGAAGPPFAALADDPAIRLRLLFQREQGLLLGRGNPLGIGALADLASRQARFVNRQRGSGTRLWLDRLLAAQGIRAGDISGYAVEEFTHQAVGALIASGAADAGLGARAVAERFGLAFLPIGWEGYYLAVGTSTPPASLDRFAAAVTERASGTAGYRPPP